MNYTMAYNFWFFMLMIPSGFIRKLAGSLMELGVSKQDCNIIIFGDGKSQEMILSEKEKSFRGERSQNWERTRSIEDKEMSVKYQEKPLDIIGDNQRRCRIES